jgi:hypothetical protein
MRKPVRLFLGAMLIALSQASIGAETSADELARCSAIAESTPRLACYDTLSGRPVSHPDVPAATVAAGGLTAVGATTSEPPADVGTESSKDNDKIVKLRVTSCVKDVRKRHIFYFEDGQVWKQVNSKMLPYKECDFMVTMKKDFFGYKMQIDGEESRIRISRVR